tara:strand:- start:8762 stop:11554 length:2793 start_codon:yes stop_codon:yes gene_type:complete
MPEQLLPNPNILKNPVLVATTFGVPTCILDWEDEILSLLPTSVGNSLNAGVTAGIDAANAMYGTLLNGIFDLIGVTIWDTKNGTFMWERELDDSDGEIDLLTDMASVIAFGTQAWNNYVVAREAYDKLESCINEILGIDQDDDTDTDTSTDVSAIPCSGIADCPPGQECINGECAEPLPFTAGSDQEAERQLLLAQANGISSFLAQANAWSNAWGDVLAKRAGDPSLEPEFTTDTSGVFSSVLDSSGPIEPIFDLVYGPPILKEGQLIMSTDGLYYNSQTETYKDGSDIPTRADIGFVPLPEAWKMDHFPSLGGKGQSYTLQDLEEYVDTLFDANRVDEGDDIKPHYAADHLLSLMDGEKSKEVYDVSTQINSLVASGYESDSAMVINLKQALYATIASYNKKINKRKKQIEVAVKAPDLYGSTSFALGEVPINDFSFLKNINLAVDVTRQKKLTFEQGEVSSIVLPLKPKFVRGVDAEGEPLLSNLVVPPIGVGTIQSQSTDGASSSSVGKVISLTDDITTDGLFAIYSFLQGNVLKPTSKEYQVLNCATRNNYNNGQLVGASSQEVFASGLGIPFLQGMTKVGFDTDSSIPTTSGVGSYLRLPESKEFQNLLYNPSGASIDFWIHMPKLNSLTRPYGGLDSNEVVTETGNGRFGTFQYHKLILACENTGGKNLNQTATEITLDKSSDVVRGFVMGFTRDNSIVESPPQATTLDQHENNTSNRMVFYIAPTQSVNSNQVEFVNKGECYNPNLGFYKMIVPISKTVNEVSLIDSRKQFVHMNVSFDVPKNEIAVYLDGNHLETSAISDVFGVNSGEAPQVPSFYKNKSDTTTSSFTYDKGSTTQVGTSEYDEGPSLDGFFTPWIVGGGWTDGIAADFTSKEGGFMNSNHGYKSGLNGFIGSLKFYSRPLNKYEVLTNYANQAAFFKNIQT